MRKILFTLLAVASLSSIEVTPAAAAPFNGAALAGKADSSLPVEEARLYCHRGPIFLHWGPCGGYRSYYYRPRYYYYRPYRHYYWRRYW